MKSQPTLEAVNLTRRYLSGGRPLTVLNGVSFSLPAGSSCAVMGPSGSGKTTLLGLLAGLDQPDDGSVVIDGRDLSTLGEEGRARFRRESLGFVFQSFRLIPTLTALENVMVPLELLRRENPQSKAADFLDRVGLKERLHHYPGQLSGGEQQRVGLARAFVNGPSLLFADEPTGNLDEETGDQISDLLFQINREEKVTLVMVTHNPELAKKTGRILRLHGGSLLSDESA